MFGIALAQIVRYGHNVPFAEDWTVVPFAHGKQPLAFDWLWSQNNEHRIPLPRLLLVALFKWTGDYRAGMYLNAVILAFLAFAMVRTAASLHGHIAYTDAFFPLAFLNWGEAENLGWSWELTFVMSGLCACLLLLIIVRQKTGTISLSDALIAGLCLDMLPLTGGTGLVYVPALALWAVLTAFTAWRSTRDSTHSGVYRHDKNTAVILAASVLLVLLISAAYFINYQRAWWNPPSPSLLATIKTTGALLAISIGPAARLSWGFFAAAMLLFFFVTGWLVVSRSTADSPLRRFGMLCYGAALACLALAIGHGRAGLVSRYGMPIRYSLVALPVLCWAYFAWQLYGPASRRLIHTALFTGILLLAPFNHHFGMQWTAYYVQGMNAIENDARAGVPAFVLCNQYQNFLMHWDGESLCAGMRMLKEAGVGILAKTRPDPVTTEIPAQSSPPGKPQWVYAIRLYLAEAPPSKGDWLDVSWGSGRRRIRLDEVNPAEQKSYLVWVNGPVEKFQLHTNKEPATLHIAKAAFLVPAASAMTTPAR
jgi:hypothetical protein